MIFADVLSNEAEVKEIIKKIFFEVFQNLSEADFSWNKEQKNYANWDSFAQLNLITLTESKFDVTLSLEESINIKSANDLFESVIHHLQ